MYKESKLNIVIILGLFFELVIFEENVLKNCVVGKENVMNGDIIVDDENEILVIENVDLVCDIIEKIRCFSDFYCFYYSVLLEGILIKSDVVKLRRKFFVFLKFKFRRGSVFFLCFN